MTIVGSHFILHYLHSEGFVQRIVENSNSVSVGGWGWEFYIYMVLNEEKSKLITHKMVHTLHVRSWSAKI